MNNFNTAISYTLDPVATAENIGGTNHWVYNFLGDGAQAAGLEKDMIVGDNNMVEVVFNGGPIGSTSDVKIVNLPDGGTTANTFLNVYDRGIDRTNVAAMFYGGTPVNSAQGYAGLSYTSIGNIALPVKFLSFYAFKNGDNAKLNWTVENDEDNKYFEIERSLDGKNYSALSKVNAMGNGRTVNTYEGYDYKLSSFGKPTAFYRIKQVDQNGEVLYSQIRSLPTDRKGSVANLYPNPARTTTKLVIDLEEQVQGSIIIRDMGGKIARQLNVTFMKGVNQHDLNVASLASGDYNVTVVAGGNTYQMKLTKIN